MVAVSGATGNEASAGSAPLAAGQTAFYDSVTPALPADDYQVIVQDTVTVDGTQQAPYSAVQRFRIAGPRAGLAPADVVAMCPPAGSQGSFDTWLPHVVLAQRSLPWQIALADPGQASVDGLPWLAVLLFTSQEIDVAGAPPAAASTGTQTVPLSAYLTPPAGTLGPQLTAGLTTLAAEQPDLTCSIVDVTYEAFRAVAPESTELPFLAHVRQVDTSDQEDLQVPAPGWYSLVVGNRFPVGAADNLYRAHLVSLEGFAGDLPDQTERTGYDLVRLLSLASWSFTSGPDPGDFAALMEGLDVSPFTVPVTITGTDAASQLVASAVADGYTMLNYASRLGEPTVAWYRGPFQPGQVAANPQPPYPAAASALIYDPATGIFDASYAAAWEIGRLLTLANGPVAEALGQWTAAAASSARLLVERGSAADPAHPAVEGSGPLDPGARQRAARQLIARQVVPALLGRVGPRPAFGQPGDPTGLRGTQLPGLLDPQRLRGLLDHSDDPYQDIRDLAITAARRQAGPDQPQEQPRAPEDGRDASDDATE